MTTVLALINVYCAFHCCFEITMPEFNVDESAMYSQYMMIAFTEIYLIEVHLTVLKIYTYYSSFISEGAEKTSQIYLRDAHILLR
jgi:hypothetical protein